MIRTIKKDLVQIPALPLRDIVVFPDMILPLFIGRNKSIKALEEALDKDKKIFLVTQKSASINEITSKDIYEIGTICHIIQLLKLPDGTLKILVETKQRAKLVKFHNDKSFSAQIELINNSDNDTGKYIALVRTLKEKFKDYIKLEERVPSDLATAIIEINDPAKLADHIISTLPLKITEKQKGLEEIDIAKRLNLALELLKSEYQVLEAENKIKNRIKTQVETSQREYYLNEQLKAIKKELGESDEEEQDEIENFSKLIKEKLLSKEAKQKASSDLKKLKAMNPISSEAGIIRNYLECLLNIPWHEPNKLKIDLKKAEEILNNQHYALDKVKERILEFIAVNKRVKKIKGPVLCLVGPPGVGKTSLAKSIAETMGRKFAKISLGGVRDEAEIRGHRKTYIGAMPGKIIQQMKKCQTSNPLFLLDEIDKMGQDFRGDPASALLEVLDPEQNASFSDHYLEVDYDLSEVMFVTTANSLNIPHALRDRMEIINVSGYTEDEKLQIAKKHLIPRQLEAHGLDKKELSLADKAILELIRKYTYEAGVRNLEREIANIARKATRNIDADEKTSKINISPKNLAKYSGIAKFDYGRIEEKDLIGVTTGLAYTEFGGDILSIEAVKIPGDGKITCTGKLGDVMKESVHAAYNYFKSRSHEFGVTTKEYQKYDIHLHVPEGATPKDGPSAGIAICTSIVSILTNIPVNRLVAMTGEITLRGRVLPIGGLKEKLLAALRAGIKQVIIPEKNRKNLADLPKNITDNLEIIYASNLDEVLKAALIKATKPAKWKEEKDKLVKSESKLSTH